VIVDCRINRSFHFVLNLLHKSAECADFLAFNEAEVCEHSSILNNNLSIEAFNGVTVQ